MLPSYNNYSLEHFSIKQKHPTTFSKNLRSLKFNLSLRFALFAVDNHLSGPLGKQKFTSTGTSVS